MQPLKWHAGTPEGGQAGAPGTPHAVHGATHQLGQTVSAGGGGDATNPAHCVHPLHLRYVHVGSSPVVHGATHHSLHSSAGGGDGDGGGGDGDGGLGGGGDFTGGGGGDLATKPTHCEQPTQPAKVQVG